MNPAERVARIKTRARDSANAKGWKIDNRLSRINNRDIYHDLKTNHYYAVYSQHGDFEVLNRRGRHQASMDLWGDKTTSRHHHVDASGGHDIIL